MKIPISFISNSLENLSRELKIFAFLGFLLAIILLFLSKNIIIFLLLIIGGLVYLSFSYGVSKGERWSWWCGLIFFTLMILSCLILFFFGIVSFLFFAISSLIPLLFLISFIRASRLIILNTGLYDSAFYAVVLGLILNITGLGFVLYNYWYLPAKIIEKTVNPGVINLIGEGLIKDLNLNSVNLADISEEYQIKKAIFSLNGNIVLVHAQKNEEQYLFVNNIKNGPFDYILDFGFSPNGNRFFYEAEKEKKWLISIDGKVEKTYDGLHRGVVFSADGQHYAYAPKIIDNTLVVVDGKEKRGEVYEAAYYLTFSPNGKRLAYGAIKYPGRRVVLDGKEHKPYGEVLDFTFSPDSQRFAYVAKKVGENKSCIILDGEEKECYGSIGGLAFSPDSQYFYYKTGSRDPVIVLDGEKQEDVIDLVYSPDSQRLVYVKKIETEERIKRTKYYVVLDSKEGKQYYYSISGLTFSPNSQHLAYITGEYGEDRKTKYFVVLDEQERERHDRVIDFTFSPDSQRLVYIAATMVPEQRQLIYQVILDNKKGENYDNIGSITFSPDSQSLAYIAKKDDSYFVVINGKEGKKYPEIYDNLIFSADSKYVAYGVKIDNSLWWMVDEVKQDI